ADIERLARAMNVRQRKLVTPDGVSTRYTDKDTLEVLVLALAGAVKPRLLSALARHGVTAVGLTGLDGAFLRARRVARLRAIVDGHRVVVRDNHAGVITTVDTSLLKGLLGLDLVPVISPPALAEDGNPVNADADRVAAAVASAAGAGDLIMLTGVPGVLRDPADERSLLTSCAVPAEGRPAEWVHAGMALKLIAAREALQAGVPRVRIADGRTGRPVTDALDGHGTRIVLDTQQEAIER
ncbi:MAG: [LysW]-aminoadipate kinase, partial [Trebonia sp.]